MKVIIGLGVVLALLIVLPSVQNVMAAGDTPGEYLDRKELIWSLFYRLMIVAFTVGTVVSGMIVWLVMRFRESNPKAKPTSYEAEGKW
ncbi:MAG: heme transporter CcmC [Candidatus Nitrosopelagicus sp.]|jgi:heme/copper-type cytochrome/quinol oxidase subunit 2|nr:heme transporter CcmC [Candidatus Nitrosopelagicus sp.]MBT6647594.1 heme transporter CcmC [Nitrososphaerota archaeon]|tara:strand:+ start:627 stop:890 length:264 start_codon:yes stop_codon:yes gene_type:complete